MKTTLLGVALLMLACVATQAQTVVVSTGRTYTIPYVVEDPEAAGVGVQVDATHDTSLVLGLARDVVVPSTDAAGTYAASSDHFDPGTGARNFIALTWGYPADAIVLPIKVIARRAGAWDLQVKRCTIVPGQHSAGTCVDSVTHLVAEDAGR